MGLCKSFFAGRPTEDVVTKRSKNGKYYAEITLGVDTYLGSEKHSNYFKLVAFDRNATAMGKYVKKGMKLIVDCQPRQDRYIDNEGRMHIREIHVVQTWEFAETKQAQKVREKELEKEQAEKKAEYAEKAKAKVKLKSEPQPEPEPQVTEPDDKPWLYDYDERMPFV